MAYGFIVLYKDQVGKNPPLFFTEFKAKMI